MEVKYLSPLDKRIARHPPDLPTVKCQLLHGDVQISPPLLHHHSSHIKLSHIIAAIKASKNYLALPFNIWLFRQANQARPHMNPTKATASGKRLEGALASAPPPPNSWIGNGGDRGGRVEEKVGPECVGSDQVRQGTAFSQSTPKNVMLETLIMF